MTVTLDVLIQNLRDQQGFKEYEKSIMDRRDTLARGLLACRPTTPPEEIHGLLGEIRGLNYALGTPEKLFRQAARQEG